MRRFWDLVPVFVGQDGDIIFRSDQKNGPRAIRTYNDPSEVDGLTENWTVFVSAPSVDGLARGGSPTSSMEDLT